MAVTAGREGMKMFFAKQRCHPVGPYALLLVFVTFAIANSPLSAQPAVWNQYTAPDHKFSVSFPGTPKVTTSGSAKGVTSASYQSPVFQACVYQIDVTTVSANILPYRKDFSDWFLQSAQQEFIKMISTSMASNMHLRAGSDHRVALGSVLGREFSSESEKYVTTQRIYLVGAPPQAFTNYVLMVICPKGGDDSTLTSKFLDSFQILPNVEQTISVNRDGWWAGDYTPLNPSDIGDACGHGTVTMHIDGLITSVDLFPSNDDYHSIGKDFAFTATLNSSTGVVYQVFLSPFGKFMGHFSSNYSNFRGTFSRGKCNFRVSLVRQRLEEFPPPGVKP
jgi:hypothetical protein